MSEPAPSLDETIKAIRTALKQRSGKQWSVKRGRGTARDWITLTAPPARQEQPFGTMSKEDRTELAQLLGLDKPCHHQGHLIPAGYDYYTEYIDRANGQTPTRYGERYWD